MITEPQTRTRSDGAYSAPENADEPRFDAASQLHTILTHDPTCENARLERDILGQRIGKGLFRLPRERRCPALRPYAFGVDRADAGRSAARAQETRTTPLRSMDS